MTVWEKAQKFEKEWWGDCLNTYGEEEKQLTYAQKMGLELFHNGKSPYNIDLQGRSVLDLGGGVASLLLKCVNRGTCMVVDPILKTAPKWVLLRYASMENMTYLGIKAELPYLESLMVYDEVWIYNVLQHTENPAKVIRLAREKGKVIRIFEWIGIKDEHGHPHELTEKGLNKWLGGEGKIEILNQGTLHGKCYYGIFKGDYYEKV